MPMTTDIRDCEKLATAIAAAGGVVPDPLGHLLLAHRVLGRPRAAEKPETAILTAALDGDLDEKLLAKLLPAAATAAMVNQYRGELARQSEHVLVGQFHRELAAGATDQILDSLRSNFDKHAEAIAAARSLINAESTAEHVIESGQPELVTAWQQLNGHISVVAKIGAIASQFGCRPSAQFPQIREYAQGDNFRLTDAGIMCTAGPLMLDSARFQQPDQGHRTSPWARTELKLHTVAEAQARYDEWTAEEFDRIHSGPRGGWIDANGQVYTDPVPPNPYRQKVSAT